MRVTVSRPSTGLFYSPGLARPIVLDTDLLPRALAEQMLALAEKAKLDDLAPSDHTVQSSRIRDARQFRMIIERGTKTSTLLVTEPIEDLDPDTKAFVDFILTQAEAVRAQTDSRNAD